MGCCPHLRPMLHRHHARSSPFSPRSPTTSICRSWYTTGRVASWSRYLGDRDRAGKIRSIVAIKDSPANRIQVFKTREKVGDRVRIFGAIDRLGLSVLRDLGGDGNINGGGLGARFAVAFYEAFWRGDVTAAQHAASRYVALMTRLIRPDWSGTFGSPQSQIKACMNMLGKKKKKKKKKKLEMLRQILEMRRDRLLTRRGGHRPPAALTFASCPSDMRPLC